MTDTDQTVTAAELAGDDVEPDAIGVEEEDLETEAEPAHGTGSAGRFRDALRAAKMAYKAAGGRAQHGPGSPMDEAIRAGLVHAEQSGRNKAAAAIRAIDDPRRSRFVLRELAAQVAEYGTYAPELRGQSAVAALLDRLPVEGETWAGRDRDLLVATFGNVLDLFYPVAEEQAP